MAQALRGLAGQPRPSQVVIPGLLDGLDRIRERFPEILAPDPGARRPSDRLPSSAPR